MDENPYKAPREAGKTTKSPYRELPLIVWLLIWAACVIVPVIVTLIRQDWLFILLWPPPNS